MDLWRDPLLIVKWALAQGSGDHLLYVCISLLPVGKVLNSCCGKKQHDSNLSLMCQLEAAQAGRTFFQPTRFFWAALGNWIFFAIIL